MESVSAKKIETEVKGGLQMGVSMKFTDLDQYLFGQGTNYEVYKKLGAHPTTYRRKKRGQNPHSAITLLISFLLNLRNNLLIPANLKYQPSLCNINPSR